VIRIARRVGGVLAALCFGAAFAAARVASASAVSSDPPVPHVRPTGTLPSLVGGSFALPPFGTQPLYWGGAVLKNVKVIGVIYGAGTFLPQMSGAAPSVESFLTEVTNSTYMDLLSEYSAIDFFGGGQTIGRGSFAGFVDITPSSSNDGAFLDDLQIQAELDDQVAASNLPAPDPDTLYVMFFRAGQQITQGFGNSYNDFCAYHNTTAGLHLRYAVMPLAASDTDPATAGQVRCGKEPGLGNFTSVLSHEVSESITDPDVGLATGLFAPLTWYDPNYGEVGDICNQIQKHVKLPPDGLKYVVQEIWSNQLHKCIATGPIRTVSVGDGAIAEGDSGARVLNIPLTLSAPSSFPITVDYTIVGSGPNPAIPGVDFDDGGGTGSVTFPMVSSKNSAVDEIIAVPIMTDSTIEPDKTFQVTITGITYGYEPDRLIGTGTIYNDDPGGGLSVSIGDASLVVPRSKSKSLLQVPVTLSGVAGSDVRVSYAVVPTGTTSKDYSGPKGGTLKIPAGSLGGVITFKVKPHLDPVPDKTLTITLSAPVNAALGRTVGTATLLGP